MVDPFALRLDQKDRIDFDNDAAARQSQAIQDPL